MGFTSAELTKFGLRYNLWKQAITRHPQFIQQRMFTSHNALQKSLRQQVLRNDLSKSKHTGAWLNQIGQYQKRQFFTFPAKSTKQLKQLEHAANSDLRDVGKQFIFLRELNKNYPNLVIRRFQETEFAKSEQIYKEYLKALVRTGQIDQMQMPEVLATLNAHASAAPLGAIAASEFGAASSPNRPVFVSMVGGSFRQQMWKLARTAAVAFIAVSAIATLVDEHGLTRPLGGSTKVMQATSSDKKFEDVKGADEAKAELEEIVHYLRDPEKYTRLGGKLPKGVLLMGPPGTGKTLLARAIAGEAGVPFFYASGSDFEEMYVGVGARRVRDLFEAAKKKSPCIIFIDEIDAIGGTRKQKDSSALKMTLNQLLVELDGFEQNNGVIVIGATNFPKVLDAALTRPGRFDRHVNVPLPDIVGRRQILELYTSNMPLAKDVSMDVLARATPGMSGAMLFNLVNEAALRSSVLGATEVDMKTFEYAKDKILMGAERKSAVISPESLKLTAYHEGGHALVAMNTPGAHPVYKATIMPRGQALGMVSQLPEGDQTSVSRKELLARLDVCMGGRVAEEMIFGKEEVTGGASSDIMQATQLARQMVTQYGMSKEVGVVFHDMSASDQMSPMTKKLIDDEVRHLCEASYARATRILHKHRKELEIIAQSLLKYETLSGQELQLLLKGKSINRPEAPKRKNSLPETSDGPTTPAAL